MQLFEFAQVKIWSARPAARFVVLVFGAMSAPSPQGNPRPAAICGAQTPLIGPAVVEQTSGVAELPPAHVELATPAPQ